MKRKITYSLRSFAQAVDDTLGLLVEVMNLDLTDLIKFKKKHKMSRRPVPFDSPLTEPQPLNSHTIPDTHEIILDVINHHLKTHHAIIELDSVKNRIILFREGEENNLTSELKRIQHEWNTAIVPSFLDWKCDRTEDGSLAFSSKKLPYLLGILAYSSQELLQQTQDSCHFQTDAHGQERFVKLFPRIDESDDLENRYPSAETWMRETNIRINADHHFIEDIRIICETLRATVDTRSQVVIKMFLNLCDIRDNPRKTRDLICHLYNKINSTSDLPSVRELITMYTLVDRLNQYVERNQLYEQNTMGQVGHKALTAPEDYVESVDMTQIDNLRNPIIAIDEFIHLCNSGQGVPVNVIIKVLPSISALNEFYADPEKPLEAKGELAKFCYLRFLKTIGYIAQQIVPQIDETAPEASTGFLSVFHLAKNTYKYYPVLGHKEDCFYMAIATEEKILAFYLKTKYWELIEQYIGSFTASVKTLEHSVDIKLIKFTLLHIQLDLDIARESLTQAIMSYQAFEKYVATQVNKIKMDTFNQYYLIMRRIGDSGQKLAAALNRKGFHLLAIDLCEDSFKQFMKQMNKIEDFVRPPHFISHTAQKRISEIKEEIKQFHSNNMRVFTEDHVADLAKAVLQIPNFKVWKLETSTTLSILPLEAGDLPYLKTACFKSKLKVQEADGCLILLEPHKVERQILRKTLHLVCILKNKAPSQAPTILPEPLIETEVESKAPEYPYFISLFHQRSQPAKKRVPKPKTQPSKPQREPAAPAAQPLRVNFGEEFGFYDEQGIAPCRIVALQDAYRPHGIYFGMLDPNLPPDIHKRYQNALANIDLTHGHIVAAGKGEEGVKFFKKRGIKSWKVKIPGQDIFLVGHIVKEIEGIDQHGLSVKRFLILFDEIQNHKQEQRMQKLL